MFDIRGSTGGVEQKFTLLLKTMLKFKIKVRKDIFDPKYWKTE